jgi:hypothetical protein
MGLRFYVESADNNECYIAIDMKSIAAMIDKKITYPSRRTVIDGETMVIHFWKGEYKGYNREVGRFGVPKP